MSERVISEVSPEELAKVVSLTPEIAEEIADKFIVEKNFEELICLANKKLESFGIIHAPGPLSLSIVITDRLAEQWCEGNEKIIEEAAKLGIKPQENYIGERLQAMSCLLQLLGKEGIDFR